MMLGMKIDGRAGLYMGAWTLAEAIARGTSGIVGGGLFDLSQWLGASLEGAYATVFAVESLGMFVPLLLVARISVARFQSESKSVVAMAVK